MKDGRASDRNETDGMEKRRMVVLGSAFLTADHCWLAQEPTNQHTGSANIKSAQYTVDQFGSDSVIDGGLRTWFVHRWELVLGDWGLRSAGSVDSFFFYFCHKLDNLWYISSKVDIDKQQEFGKTVVSVIQLRKSIFCWSASLQFLQLHNLFFWVYFSIFHDENGNVIVEIYGVTFK